MWWRSAVNLSFFLSFAVRRMRSSPSVTLARLGVRSVLGWLAFPSIPALRSTGSAADRSALFAGFPATMAGSDIPPPCIIGYGSSPSRCGPPASAGDGQMRDLPVSSAILLRVTCSSTPAGCTAPRITVLSMLRSAAKECLRPQRDGYFGAQSHTPRSSCVRFVALVTSGSRNTRLQTGSLRLAWAGLSPADRASLLAPSLCPPYKASPLDFPLQPRVDLA